MEGEPPLPPLPANPSAPHRISAATSRVVRWLGGIVGYLGALAGLISLWPYWWYAVPGTVIVGGIAIGVALIPFAHEQVKKATAVASAPPARSDETSAVTLHLLYADDQFRVFNDGNRNLYLWGTRLDGGKKTIGPKPLIVSPGPVGDFVPVSRSLHQEFLSKVHVGRSAQTPMTLYLKNDVGEEWIARFTLLITNERGVVNIVTQPNDVVKHHWSDSPAPPRDVTSATLETSPGVPEARAAKISERLFQFVARRNDVLDHPLGLMASTMQGRTGALQAIAQAMLPVSSEALANGKRYDAETLALYYERYHADVNRVRFAVVNLRVSADPTQDALILEGPACVADIKVIARYLRELVIATPPAARTTTQAASHQRPTIVAAVAPMAGPSAEDAATKLARRIRRFVTTKASRRDESPLPLPDYGALDEDYDYLDRLSAEFIHGMVQKEHDEFPARLATDFILRFHRDVADVHALFSRIGVRNPNLDRLLFDEHVLTMSSHRPTTPEAMLGVADGFDALAAAPQHSASGLATVIARIVAKNGSLVDQAAVVAVSPEGSGGELVHADERGVAELTVAPSARYTVLVAHPDYVGASAPLEVDKNTVVEITLEAREGHASVILEDGYGEIPGLKGHLNPIDGYGGTSLYALNPDIEINGGVDQPVQFAVNEELTLKDIVGAVFLIRFRFIRNRTSLIQYARQHDNG